MLIIKKIKREADKQSEGSESGNMPTRNRTEGKKKSKKEIESNKCPT